MKVLLSVDVEDAFHAENMRMNYPADRWTDLPSQLPDVVDSLLEKLEKLEVKATFFVLGWSARKCPEIVRRIADSGHEVASHGMTHRKLTELSPDEVKSELIESKNLLEDITGKSVDGFRAPSFSITRTAIEALKESGYTYDSSYHPFRAHGNYGDIGPLGSEVKKNIFDLGNSFWEVALPVISFSGLQLPIGGGAYFRFLPSSAYRFLTQKWTNKHEVLTYYTHPWELEAPEISLDDLSYLRRIRQSFRVKNGIERTVRWIGFMKSKGCHFETASSFLNGLART